MATAAATELKYGYEKVMQENNLQLSDLTDDAKYGISQIRDIDKMAVMQEKKTGKPRTEATQKKIKYHDKNVCNEIYDMLQDKDAEKKAEAASKKAEQAGAYKGEGEGASGDEGGTGDSGAQQGDGKPDGNAKPEAPTKEALEIEAELDALFKSGKKDFPLDELKTTAPKVWNTIFSNYSEDDDNGIETSKYTLLEENEQNVFVLSKK